MYIYIYVCIYVQYVYMRVLIHCWATKILAYDDWMGTRHQSIHRSGASKYPIEWRHLTQDLGFMHIFGCFLFPHLIWNINV